MNTASAARVIGPGLATAAGGIALAKFGNDVFRNATTDALGAEAGVGYTGALGHMFVGDLAQQTLGYSAPYDPVSVAGLAVTGAMSVGGGFVAAAAARRAMGDKVTAAGLIGRAATSPFRAIMRPFQVDIDFKDVDLGMGKTSPPKKPVPSFARRKNRARRAGSLARYEYRTRPKSPSYQAALFSNTSRTYQARKSRASYRNTSPRTKRPTSSRPAPRPAPRPTGFFGRVRAAGAGIVSTLNPKPGSVNLTDDALRAARYGADKAWAFGASPKTVGIGAFAVGAAATYSVSKRFMTSFAEGVAESAPRPRRDPRERGPRSRRSTMTGSRVQRLSNRRRTGDPSGIGATGDLVFALNRTGGRGGVIT